MRGSSRVIIVLVASIDLIVAFSVSSGVNEVVAMAIVSPDDHPYIGLVRVIVLSLGLAVVLRVVQGVLVMPFIWKVPPFILS